MQIYSHEEANRHSGTMVFLLGNLLSSIPFLFLVSILSSLVFYFLIGLRNEFSSLMYFVTTIFVCLLANEALMMVISYIWLETYKCTLTLVFLHVRRFFFPFVFFGHAEIESGWLWIYKCIMVSGYHDACGWVSPNTRKLALSCVDLPAVLHLVPHIRCAGKLPYLVCIMQAAG